MHYSSIYYKIVLLLLNFFIFYIMDLVIIMFIDINILIDSRKVDYDYKIKDGRLYISFKIEPNKCKCRFNRNHTYSVNTTSIFDETTKKNRITSLKVVCNTCFASSYFYITKSKCIFEEDLDYT